MATCIHNVTSGLIILDLMSLNIMKFKIRHGSHTQSSHGPKSGCRSHIMTENSLSPTNIIQAVTFTFEQFAIIQNVK